MAPYRVRDFPDTYPKFLAACTRCLLQWNKYCILGIQLESGELDLEEEEAYLQFKKEAQKLLQKKVNFHTKCELYLELKKKYGPSEEEKVEWNDQLAESEEDSWEDGTKEVSMEETCEEGQGCQTEDVR
ncbi:v2 [Limeum africanum associated virus]|uniref:v2 n=1 Tax=Limeum africanum associated virus TaxID=2093276 RepID=UPI000CD3396D|nr:v2 [Limeum africanum associated virus]AUT11880.1 v2 [Limeum africanum associated virus]